MYTLLLLLAVTAMSTGAQLDILYPFGPDDGDNELPPGDLVSSRVIVNTLNTGFPFIYDNHSTLFIHNDGVISFEGEFVQSRPTRLPMSSVPFIAVYWADVRTTAAQGRVYYRQVTDGDLLEEASKQVQESFAHLEFFQATWLFIATWHKVMFYGTRNESLPLTNTYQAVLITDGYYSFVMMNYGTLTWTTGVLSGGNKTTGRGGTAAVVGFNRGDNVYSYTHPLSLRDGIRFINRSSNIDNRFRGRWIYRVDGRYVKHPGACEQTPSGPANFPVFRCPRLSGPTVRNRTFIEFHCEVNTTVTDARAVFEISFLFNGVVPANFRPIHVRAPNPRATLHEKYLFGRLEQLLTCMVISYWDNTPGTSSPPTNSSNSFRPRLQPSSYTLSVNESDIFERTKQLLLYSNLPITCLSPKDNHCWITFNISTNTGDVALRQLYNGQALYGPEKGCTYQMDEEDWKQDEGYAFSEEKPLQLIAKVSIPVIAPRVTEIYFTAVFKGNRAIKTDNGTSYPNPWSSYSTRRPVLVFRYDSPSPLILCHVTGDPRVAGFGSPMVQSTFGRYHTISGAGNFIYAQSKDGLPFEIQVIQWECGGIPVTCACGVAMRENDLILALDGCNKTAGIKPLTYNVTALPDDTGITVTTTGESYKIQMPSGSKIFVYYQPSRPNMELDIYVSERLATRGLCGSSKDPTESIVRHKITDVAPGLVGSQDTINPATTESWRVPDGEDLFKGQRRPLSVTPTEFCLCNNKSISKCGRKAVSDTFPDKFEPQNHVRLGMPFNPVTIPNRRRKRQIDEVIQHNDWRVYPTIYRPMFFYREASLPVVRWPAPNGITEEEATAYCTNVITNTSYIGRSCYTKLRNSAAARSIIRACIDDIQLTGDLTWANNRVPVMQQNCVDEILYRNYTEFNDTEEVIDIIAKEIEVELSPYKCVPFDCNGNGQCVDGSCVCDPNYRDVDCSLLKTAVPQLTGFLEDPPSCTVKGRGIKVDEATRICVRAELTSINVLSNATCRIVVTTNTSVATYYTRAHKVSPTSTSCELPSEPLRLYFDNYYRLVQPAESNFFLLSPGGATQKYDIAVSNDEATYSNAEKYTIYDSDCMDCDGSDCIQQPRTCIINGYCFKADDSNPYISCLKCKPDVSTTNWTLDVTYKELLSPTQLALVASLSGCHEHRRIVNCEDMCYHQKYRTLDGTCNNLRNTMLGASLSPLLRLQPPRYENNFNFPVGWDADRLYNGVRLPSARAVSVSVLSTSRVTPDDAYSHMLMQWGQFIDHDVDFVPTAVAHARFSDGRHCNETCEASGPCFPIPVSADDPRVRRRRCIGFVRSSAMCGSGTTSVFFNDVTQREQLNALTSYIDASMIYGSSDDDARNLRDFASGRGLLRTSPPATQSQKPLLPPNQGEFIDCQMDASQTRVPCFQAGDHRANEQLGLLAMHTLWLREHNRVASELLAVNPHWDSDTVYHEARKVVGAVVQHITYRHWLPKLLGDSAMRRLVGPYAGYDPNVDPRTSNEFAGAAFRFGHALVQPLIARLNESYQPIPAGNLALHRAFFAPFRLVEEGGVDPIVRGLIGLAAKRTRPGEVMNFELTERLFALAHDVALDLAAFNVQRGRDHGLRSYNDYRRHCGLSTANTFDDFGAEIRDDDVRRKLHDVYRHPDNVDLFVGGMVEDPIDGARVGPTFICIIADQFRRLRDGDRLWYENPGVFTDSQLVELRQASLARVICDNSDAIRRVPRDVFLFLPSLPDGQVSCDDIPTVDLKVWAQCCRDCARSGDFRSITHHFRTARSVDQTPAVDEYERPQSDAAADSAHRDSDSTVRDEMMHMSQKMMDVVDVRIEGMEDMLQHLQTTVHQFGDKLTEIEKTMPRGRRRTKKPASCLDNHGQVQPHGSSWTEYDCRHCQCKNGELECTTDVCPMPECPTPVKVDGQCCPVCPA